jgi:hypothetical protein
MTTDKTCLEIAKEVLTLSGDGTTVLLLLGLLGVREVRDDGCDALGGGTLAGVDHDQEFHEGVIDLGRSRLDNVHILVTDRDT